MPSKLVSKPNETRMWIAVLGKGEEAKQSVLALAKKGGIEAASFVALGAFEKATLGYFDWQKKKYRPIAIDEQVEVITLVGDMCRTKRASPACMPIPCWAAAMAAPAAVI